MSKEANTKDNSIGDRVDGVVAFAEYTIGWM